MTYFEIDSWIVNEIDIVSWCCVIGANVANKLK